MAPKLHVHAVFHQGARPVEGCVCVANTVDHDSTMLPVIADTRQSRPDRTELGGFPVVVRGVR